MKMIRTAFVDLSELPLAAHRAELDRLYDDAKRRNLGFGLPSSLNLDVRMPYIHVAFQTA